MNKSSWLRSFFVLRKLLGSTEKDSCCKSSKKLFSLIGLAVIKNYNSITTSQSSENGKKLARAIQNAISKIMEDLRTEGLNEPPIVLQSTGKLAIVECKKAAIISFYGMVIFHECFDKSMIKFVNITKYTDVVAVIIHY